MFFSEKCAEIVYYTAEIGNGTSEIFLMCAEMVVVGVYTFRPLSWTECQMNKSSCYAEIVLFAKIILWYAEIGSMVYRHGIKSFIITDTDSVELVLYTKEQVTAALERIKSHPIDSQKLMLETLDSNEGPLEEQQLQKPETTSESQVFDEGRSSGEKVTSRKPHTYTFLANFVSRANELYGFSNQEELSRLMEFLYLNGRYELIPVKNKGSFLYAAARRGIDTPAEYTNSHLGWQVVMMVLQYPDFIYPLLMNTIMGIYGHSRMDPAELVQRKLSGSIISQEAADQRLQGHLVSIVFYSTWQFQIHGMMSMILQLRITVVYGESLLQEKISHNRPLDNTDLVVVFCGGAYHIGVGEHLFCSGQR